MVMALSVLFALFQYNFHSQKRHLRIWLKLCHMYENFQDYVLLHNTRDKELTSQDITKKIEVIDTRIT